MIVLSHSNLESQQINLTNQIGELIRNINKKYLSPSIRFSQIFNPCGEWKERTIEIFLMKLL